MRAVYFQLTILIASSFIAGCATHPYGTPRDTSDPWQLIYDAREWLDKGRPRGALPSLEKALSVLERSGERVESDHQHAEAAVYNELGRVYVMTGDLGIALQNLLQAENIAAGLPKRRPLNFDITYNLSTVFEQQQNYANSCERLQRAAEYYRSMLAHPAEPPEGYGVNTSAFLRDVAKPRIAARANRIGCEIGQLP